MPRARRSVAPDAGAGAERLHRGRTLEQRQAERRAALLEAALACFGTKGYAATSIDELCRTSFVTQRYFYEEFGGREGLLLALYDHLMAGVVAGVMAVDEPPGPDHVRAATRGRIAAFVHGVADDERVARVLFLEGGGMSADLERRRRDAHALFARYVADLARPYVAAGEIEPRDLDLHLLALGFVGAVNEVVTHWVLTDPADRVSIDQIIDTSLAMYLLVRDSLARPR